MDFTEFNKILKNKEVENAYLFKGTENYLMEKYIENIKKVYIDENFSMINYIEIDSSGNFEQILNACETLPFMSEKKLIVIKDINELSQGDKSIMDKLNDYLSEVSNDNILIVRDKNDNLKKTTKLYKSFNKKDRVVEFNRLNVKQLNSFIGKLIRDKDKTIDDTELNYIVQKSGYLTYKSEKTLFEMENEIAKIIDSSKEIKISKEDIDKNMIVDVNANIFNLIDSLMGKDLRTSLIIFNNIYESGEPISKLLFMLIRHFRLLNKYIVYSGQGYGMNDINQKLKISPYELKKIDKFSRVVEGEKVNYILSKLLEFDIRQKSVALDGKLSMELLIADIIKNM